MDATVPVVVRDVAPQATFTAGTQIANAAVSGQNVWAIQPGQTLAFDNVIVPSDTDAAKLTYDYEIDDVETVSNVPKCCRSPQSP